uniref:Reverse transcriptase domain-containing protein n=1 Tax=Tanacetum cinerariifolium TaxID=118510 RepID=A0A699IHI0_TANCI|nr:hypothetical protein [Tanacetum cinerariifolium]
MEDTMLELIEVCRQKEFYCMHDNVDDIIESSLNSRLLSINLESQCLNKKKQEVKNVVEQPTKKPAYSPSMTYEHLSTIPETESNEVLKSSAKNLLPILSEYEVTFDDESECDVPVKDESFLVFTTFSNPLFDCNDDITSSNDESLPDEDVLIEEFKVYSNPLSDTEEINYDEIDLHCFNVESDFVESLSNHNTLINSSLKFDFLEEFSGALLPTSNFNAIVETLPKSPILIEDSDSQRKEIDIFTGIDNLLPSSFESDDDLKEEIYVLEELLFDDSISLSENKLFYFDHQDDPSFPRPPPEPPDVFFNLEPDSGEEISVVMNNIEELFNDECFNPGGEINVFANDEDDDYFSFMFVIRIFPTISYLF